MNESRYILVVDSVLHFLYVEYLYRRNPICSIADGVDPVSLDQHKLPHITSSCLFGLTQQSIE